MTTAVSAAESLRVLVAEVALAAAESPVRGVLRAGDPAKWDLALAALSYIPVAYSSAWVEYQLAYQRGAGGDWSDLSLILHRDNRPCGVWPLSACLVAGNTNVTSHGFPVQPPLLVADFPDKPGRVVVRACQELWQRICRICNVTSQVSAESFGGREGSGLSEWHAHLMRCGARPTLQHELFVDLSQPIDAIRAHFRKSYKPLITSGMRIWQVGEMTGEDLGIWEEFRALHLRVAGRVTRSALSWELQHKAIVDGNAFLVFLRNGQAEMVGGGLFCTTRDEAVYGVGAYDRSLFDKPLGHVVQYRAIEAMKKLGLRWYKIGLRPYASDHPTPSEKEISIGDFKQGFATHLFPRYVLDHELEAANGHR